MSAVELWFRQLCHLLLLPSKKWYLCTTTMWYMCTCMSMYRYITYLHHIHVYMYVHTCVHVCNVCTCMYIHVCVYIHTYYDIRYLCVPHTLCVNCKGFFNCPKLGHLNLRSHYNCTRWYKLKIYYTIILEKYY